jgi:glutamate racemase
VIGLPCPEFAPMIEAGHIRRDDPVVQNAVFSALAPIRGMEFGALLLGCTHYGIIEDAIRDVLGEDAPLLSASACAAEALCKHLTEAGLLNGRDSGGTARCFESGDIPRFEAFAEPYLETPVRAERAPIMEL